MDHGCGCGCGCGCDIRRNGGAPFIFNLDYLYNSVPKLKQKIRTNPNLTSPTKSSHKPPENELPPPSISVKMAENELPPSPAQSIIDMEFKLLTHMIEESQFPSMMTENEFPPLAIIYAAANHPAMVPDIVFPPPTDFKFVTMEELHSVKTTENELPPPASAHPSAPNPPDSNSMVRVVVDYRGKRTPVEVKRDDRVATLREKLVEMGVTLPEGPYFFVHRQDTTEDDQTFRWHHVSHGDHIYLFPGYVTRGS